VNKLILVSGHSGSGKTSIMKSLMDNEVISFTTREKRTGEREGADYKFISLQQFKQMKNENRLIEWVEYSGNFYGIDSDEFEQKINKDHAFCIVDYHGMKQFKDYYPNCCTIFLYTPYEQAFHQMKSRGDEEDKIQSRLNTYVEEIKNKVHYDYTIRNNSGKFEDTREIIRNIISSEVN
jgi:guanylate kinase